jgi:arylsulfatase A-like enzyme
MPHNLFRLLKDSLHLNAFSQNIYADMLLYQFEEYIENHPALDSFSLAGHTYYNHLFPRDAIYGMRSYDQFLFVREEAHGSLFLSLFDDLAVQLGNRRRSEELADIYPEELPRLANTDVNFRLDQVTDGVRGFLDGLESPFFTYIHFMPPHAPYVPSRDYIGIFDDGWSPPAKKVHRLAAGISEKRMYELRHTYDEYVANLDAQFGRLIDHLEETGLLDTSYVIFTSDHGELFERGAVGHSTPLVFEPVVHIPLIISAPGQRERKDVHALTSNVDLLPTILRIAGLDIPEWCEGQILPGLGGEEKLDRSVYVVEAKANPAYKPFRKATLAILKGQYKLIQYLGYRYYKDRIECYDLENDPNELHNLYPAHPMAKELWDELQLELERVNRPFMKR